MARAQAPADFVPVTDAMLRDPAPADWPMWRRTLDGWGYSPLDEITRERRRPAPGAGNNLFVFALPDRD